jgi:hypothetical protein
LSGSASAITASPWSPGTRSANRVMSIIMASHSAPQLSDTALRWRVSVRHW